MWWWCAGSAPAGKHCVRLPNRIAKQMLLRFECSRKSPFDWQPARAYATFRVHRQTLAANTTVDGEYPFANTFSIQTDIAHNRAHHDQSGRHNPIRCGEAFQIDANAIQMHFILATFLFFFSSISFSFPCARRLYVTGALCVDCIASCLVIVNHDTQCTHPTWHCSTNFNAIIYITYTQRPMADWCNTLTMITNSVWWNCKWDCVWLTEW